MQNARPDEAQTGIKTASRNINNLRYADDTNLMVGGKRNYRRVKEKSEKADLKQHSKNKNHRIWSHFFMANRRGKVEAVTDFIFLGSKITGDSDCSHEIKRCLLL